LVQRKLSKKKLSWSLHIFQKTWISRALWDLWWKQKGWQLSKIDRWIIPPGNFFLIDFFSWRYSVSSIFCISKKRRNTFDHCFFIEKDYDTVYSREKFDNDDFCHYDEESNAVYCSRVVFENTDKFVNENKQDIRHRTRRIHKKKTNLRTLIFK
jgi:hypothetical protein